MNTPDDRYPDLLGPQAPPERRRLVADLDRVCAVSRLPASRDAAIARALQTQAAERNAPSVTGGRSVAPARLPRHRALAIGATLAALIVLGSTYAALRGQTGASPTRPPTPALTGTAFATLGTRGLNIRTRHADERNDEHPRPDGDA